MSDKVPGHVETPWGMARVDDRHRLVVLEPLRPSGRDDIPSVAQAAQALLPYLKIWCDAGYPTLTEPQRDAANNARVDMEIALGRMLR